MSAAGQEVQGSGSGDSGSRSEDDEGKTQPAHRLGEAARHPGQGAGRTALAALQWLVFITANSVVAPVTVGAAYGLPAAMTGRLVLGTLLLIGLVSLGQVLLGHRYPLFDGPAGLWWSTFLLFATLAPALGRPPELVLRQLGAGLIVAGLVVAALGWTGLVSRLSPLFTPSVTGSYLLLLALQLSGPFLRGLLGAGYRRPDLPFDPPVALTALAVAVLVTLLSLYGRGLWRGLSVLLGTAVGWALFAVQGLAPAVQPQGAGWLALPTILPFGPPDWDSGMVLMSVLIAVILLVNLVASVLAMSRVLGVATEAAAYNRSAVVTGLADVLAGAGGVVGFAPISGAAALVGLTGEGSRLPFALGGLALVGLGLVAPLGRLLASLPSPVGYAVGLAGLAQLAGFGLGELRKTDPSPRTVVVVGLPLIAGVGLMGLPLGVIAALPAVVRLMVGNGLLAGVLLVLLLEHLLPRQ